MFIRFKLCKNSYYDKKLISRRNKKSFNIINDFTPEEEAYIHEENKWTENDIWIKISN